MARRRRVTYRPSKAQGAFGVIWGGIFVVIGLVVVIPLFGPFGVLWTLAALAITVMNGVQAFGKGYVGPEIHIEEEGETPPHPSAPSEQNYDHIPSMALGAKERLEQLEALKDAGLVTDQEYQKKRSEILDDL